MWPRRSGLGLSKHFLPPLKSWQVEASEVFWPLWKGCSRWGQLPVTPDWLPGQADENPRQCSWLPLVSASCLLSFSLTFRVFSARWRSMCAASTQKRSTSARSATRPSAVPTSCVCTCFGTRTARTSCAPRVGSSLRCEPAAPETVAPGTSLLILRLYPLCSQQGLELYFVSVFDLKVIVAQSCLTLCGPMDCSPAGSSVHGILQARIPEWVAISFSRASSWPRDLTPRLDPYKN